MKLLQGQTRNTQPALVDEMTAVLRQMEVCMVSVLTYVLHGACSQH